MAGGYASVYDNSALSIVAAAIDQGSDVTSEVETAEVDRRTKELQHMALIVLLQHAITGSAADDTIDVSFAIKEADEAGGSFTTKETKTVVISGTQAETDATHNSVVVLPLNLAKYKRAIKIGVTVAAGSGASLTLSSAEASAVFNQFPQNGQPDATYDKDGYHVEG